MIDPFSPLGAAIYAGATLAVGAVMIWRGDRRHQSGRDNLARWLATDHQHLIREDRDDLGADQCPYQLTDTHSILNGGERIGIGHHSHREIIS